MDCQKFDQVVMDALYEELDELTYAALRRHVESCARCGEAWNGLRATREVAMLPLEEPSPGLEDRILAAVTDAQRTTPWHRKALRALAWAGSHAMRPQLAMAALFFLVIGSSLLLLRAKPGTVGITPVRVTERGVPAPDEGDLSQAAAPAQPPPVAAVPMPMAAAEPAEGAKKSKDDAADKAAAKETDGAGKALAEARATRDGSGCDAALRLYDDVGARYPGTPQAADAMWEAAQCQRSLGNTDRARELYSALKQSDGYKARAEEALKESEAQTQMNNAGGGAVANRAAAPAPAPPAATATVAGKPAGRAAAASPALETEANEAKAAPGGGPGRNVNAAPKRAYEPAPSNAAGY
ncbi:tetratricopeptide repeat protein [Polyangium jinanense]|uniref:Tetratricopeptide repeat protein n=1 Tax=Polyangium jinanense TaxID=2829994 RepID=A0A9X4AW10_9BACT|nr:tetratricopeptide repeat protein [Polyangium jinanense]MDC3959473.1 tetratricopeptide repeat protein [Polyangium jinanense]MDC3984907.1 tetratricopeptide repeat protein [Polyangium jinanense]